MPAMMLYTGRGAGPVNEYIGIAVSFVLAAGIAGAMVYLGSTLGKKKPTSVKLAPFECGNEPVSLPMGRLAIKFYLTAILFILFDVELVFLYPWAVVYRALGVSGLIEMGVFLGVLMVGFVYVWDSGALKWQ
jgi:NADH-quinone oxidoreductase subunit A